MRKHIHALTFVDQISINLSQVWSTVPGLPMSVLHVRKFFLSHTKLLIMFGECLIAPAQARQRLLLLEMTK